MGDCAVIWKWWPVFILAVSYNTLKITQAPKRERDWRQLGNPLFIPVHSILLRICPFRHFLLTHLSKGCSFFYLSTQYLLDVLQNSYLSFHNIMPPKCDPQTHEVIAAKVLLPRPKGSRIRVLHNLTFGESSCWQKGNFN